MRAHLAVALLCAVPLAAQSPTTGAGTPPLTIDLVARAFQPGELVLLTLSLPGEPARVDVSVFGRKVPTFRDGDREWRALVGIDLDQAPGTYQVVADARLGSGPARAQRTLIVLPKAFPRRTLRVNPDFVNPPASTEARIEEEARFLQRLYTNPASQRLWTGAFVRPVDEQANSAFGTRSVYNGQARNPHAGTDFLSGTGTPVRAPNAGRVVAARDLYFTGGTVVIDHGLGLFSILAHLSRIDVEEGEAIDPGRVIGLVGATGRVTGPHLHWSLRAGTARVDPLSALEIIKAPSP
jgi:murein DD-endopeptidase MepM/ murein hydrolase activator NlpD